MSCHELYRSDALEVASCVGDASRRSPAATQWPSFEVHFQDDGAYFVHEGRETVLVDVHHVELRRARSTQTYSRPVVNADRGMSVRFSPELLGDLSAADADPAVWFPTGVVRLGWRGFSQLRALRHALEITPDRTQAVDRRVVAFVASIVRGALRRTARSGLHESLTALRHRRAVERTKAYLVEHCHDRPSLCDVASAVDYAPHHLARVFRDETGLSVHRYLTELRVRQAAARLHDGANNLSSLALDLGFSSQSHFTTTFREHFGCTPGAYRAQIHKRLAPLP